MSMIEYDYQSFFYGRYFLNLTYSMIRNESGLNIISTPILIYHKDLIFQGEKFLFFLLSNDVKKLRTKVFARVSYFENVLNL